jgi:ABC-2 type transport system ATP-binding protein
VTAHSGNVAIRLEHVSKEFTIRRDKSLKERLVNAGRSRRHAEHFVALDDVSFDVPTGSTVGLIGHNGSGKSTLLKLVGGILRPTSGSVRHRGRIAALLELGAGFHGDLTGRENVYLNASLLGLSRAQTDKHFDDIVEFSEIPEKIDTQVKFYSSGQYVRLAFAVAVHVDPEILLVDEVLAVGDEPFQRKCLDRIRTFQAEGRTIVLVTHGLDTVRDMCDRAVVLDHGHMLLDGTAVEGVRLLRDLYSEQAHAQSVENADAEQVLARIAGGRLNGSGASTPRLAPGDQLTIDVDVDSTLDAGHPVTDWAVGISLTNHGDAVAFGTNTHLLGQDLPPLRGRATIRYQLPELHLAEDTYHVTAAVHPIIGAEWHRVDRVQAFRVFGGVHQDGLVSVDPEVSVHPGTGVGAVPATDPGEDAVTSPHDTTGVHRPAETSASGAADTTR